MRCSPDHQAACRTPRPHPLLLPVMTRPECVRTCSCATDARRARAAVRMGSTRTPIARAARVFCERMWDRSLRPCGRRSGRLGARGPRSDALGADGIHDSAAPLHARAAKSLFSAPMLAHPKAGLINPPRHLPSRTRVRPPITFNAMLSASRYAHLHDECEVDAAEQIGTAIACLIDLVDRSAIACRIGSDDRALSAAHPPIQRARFDHVSQIVRRGREKASASRGSW